MPTSPMQTPCGGFFVAVKQVAGSATRYLAFRARCKSWDCPDCRKIKAERYKKLMHEFFVGRQLWLYTFTYYHSTDPHTAWKTYNTAWNTFKTAARKKYGGFAYIRILESHNASPYPHLHILIDKKFDSRWWQIEAQRAGFGWQLDSKKVTTAGACHYITKYLTKEWKNETAWKLRKECRCRILSCSVGVCAHQSNGGSWDIVARCADLVAAISQIDVDFTWQIGKKGRVTHCEETDDYYECTVYFSENTIL